MPSKLFKRLRQSWKKVISLKFVQIKTTKRSQIYFKFKIKVVYNVCLVVITMINISLYVIYFDGVKLIHKISIVLGDY